jgi:hypothetical protein
VIYLYWYMGVGAVTLVVMYLSHKLRSKSEAAGFKDVLGAMNPERKNISYLIINNFLVPVLGSVFALIFWPALLYLKLKDMRDRGSDGRYEEKVFMVTEKDLVERLTTQVIESAEVIDDPLEAVPKLPFGHLNKCWIDLLTQKEDGDEFWSFKTTWEGNWGRTEIRSGYALVRGGNPQAFILTGRIPVENEKKK